MPVGPDFNPWQTESAYYGAKNDLLRGGSLDQVNAGLVAQGIAPAFQDNTSAFGDFSGNLKETAGAALQGWGPAIGGLIAGPAGLDVGGAVGGATGSVTAGAVAQGAAGGAIGSGISGGDVVAGAGTGALTAGATSGVGADGAVIGGGGSPGLDPTGLGAGDVAFSGGGLGLSSAASGGPTLDPTGLGPSDVTTSPAGSVSMLSTASPTMTLTPETMSMLGINNTAPTIGDLPIDASLGSFGTPMGAMPGGAPEMGGAFGGVNDNYVGDFATDPNAGTGGGPSSYLDQTTALLKKLGLTPAQAGLLGIAGYGMTKKSSLPESAKTLQEGAGPAAAQANTVIQSGGTSSPAWQGQKASIDATIDQQIQQQSQAMMQQAINSGQGADSQVTLQQINKLKNDLETKRQQLYVQAQGQNVEAALHQLGISDTALANVTNAQFSADSRAQQMAMTTAELALLLGSRG